MTWTKIVLAMTIIIASVSASPLMAMSNELEPTAEQSEAAIPSTTQNATANRQAVELSPTTSMSAESKDAFTHTNPRLVLALSGGAFKAVAEIGILRSLERNRIKIDAIVGTSMGATIGALYCAGVSIDKIEEMFLDNTIQNAMLSGAGWHILTSPVARFTYIFTGRPYAGVTDGKGYLNLLKQKLPATFEQLKLPFAAVVTNLTDGQTTVLAHGELPLAVLASNCIPTIYRPVMINGHLYVDGGLKANLPSNIAQSMGADIVVAALVDTAIGPVSNKKFKSKKQLVLRVMDIMMASSDKMQTRTSDILIYPDVDFVPAFTKNPDILRRAIAAGEKAADSVAAKIQSELNRKPAPEAKNP